MSTDPNRPSVGLAPSDDIPLVIESSDKLPSERRGCISGVIWERKALTNVDPQVETAHDCLDIFRSYCQRTGEIGYRKPGQRSIRTKILPNLNGIMEVDHCKAGRC